MLAWLAFCEMLSQYPQSAFRRFRGVTRGGQQQFATQTLRVHLLGIEYSQEFVFPRFWRSLGELFGVNSYQNPLFYVFSQDFGD